jgi:hypothetical protein
MARHRIAELGRAGKLRASRSSVQRWNILSRSFRISLIWSGGGDEYLVDAPSVHVRDFKLKARVLTDWPTEGIWPSTVITKPPTVS